MDCKNRKIVVYTQQPAEVLKIIEEQGKYFVQLRYISRKYQSVKDVFLNAYLWYVYRASQIVIKPDQAESAVWSFLDLRYLERHQDSFLLKLAVPMEEAVFFRMSDWNKVLNMKYIGENQQEEERFDYKIKRNGIGYEGDVYLTPYYPQLKRELILSWEQLFRFDLAMKKGEITGDGDMQAGLWCIRKEWFVDIV